VARTFGTISGKDHHAVPGDCLVCGKEPFMGLNEIDVLRVAARAGYHQFRRSF